MSSVRGDSACEDWILVFRVINLLIFKQVDTLSFKTISANKATVNKEWVIVDAEGQTLGRLLRKGSEAFAW